MVAPTPNHVAQEVVVVGCNHDTASVCAEQFRARDSWRRTLKLDRRRSGVSFPRSEQLRRQVGRSGVLGRMSKNVEHSVRVENVRQRKPGEELRGATVSGQNELRLRARSPHLHSLPHAAP